MTDKFPQKTSPETAVKAFLRESSRLPARADSGVRRGGRLIFALDATASRQPSWDRACQLHGEMFNAAKDCGGLSIQLCYYRGFNEFHASPWQAQADGLLREMTAVRCLGGYTQIGRLLQHTLAEARQKPVNAIVFIGDAVEENVDALCEQAGQCGLLGAPLFLFQEGNHPDVARVFSQMARLSKGAYARFDAGSAQQLAELLRAVATYASGGMDALKKLSSGPARALLTQL